MQYEFWSASDGTMPVREEMRNLKAKDAESAVILVWKLESLEAYSFGQLWRSHMVKKVRGKLWEWRPHLKDKTCRIFFVIDHEGKMWLLEMIIKKNMKLKNKDIEVAEQRARTIY